MTPDQFQTFEPSPGLELSEPNPAQAAMDAEPRRILVRGPVMIYVEFDRNDPEQAAIAEPDAPAAEAEVIQLIPDQRQVLPTAGLLEFDSHGLDEFTGMKDAA